jgi:hypothetical protein
MKNSSKSVGMKINEDFEKMFNTIDEELKKKGKEAWQGGFNEKEVHHIIINNNDVNSFPVTCAGVGN